MALSIPVVWSDAHRLHAPETAIWVGVRIDADELPERADRIRATLEDAGARVVDAEPHDDAALLAVHDAGLVDFLRTAWADWDDAGLPGDPGQPDVVGYIFPTPGLLGGFEPRVPTALSARTGAWCFDTMTAVATGHLGSRAGGRRHRAHRGRPRPRRRDLLRTRAVVRPATTSRDRRSAAPAT